MPMAAPVIAPTMDEMKQQFARSPFLVAFDAGIAAGAIDDLICQAPREGAFESGHADLLHYVRFSTYNRKHATW